jgi:hypothetical protein
MVEGQHLVEEEQAGVGNCRARLWPGGQALDLAHRVVGEKPTAPAVNGGKPGSRAGLCPPSAWRSTAKMSPSMLVVFPRPSVMAISRPRATIRLKG